MTFVALAVGLASSQSTTGAQVSGTCQSTRDLLSVTEKLNCVCPPNAVCNAQAADCNANHQNAIAVLTKAAARHCGQSSPPCPKVSLQDFVIRNKWKAKGGVPIRTVSIWKSGEGKSFFYVSNMEIDADGAPNAYNPQDTGLDALQNAGGPGDWHRLVTDKSGAPVIQGASDPFPGYYVSKSALEDLTLSRSDPKRYVDSTKIPYIVLPPAVASQGRAKLGDFASVVNLENGQVASAIYADVAITFNMGEGSVAWRTPWGSVPSPRKGKSSMHILYLVFPNSGNGRPRSLEEINTKGKRLFDAFGGTQQVSGC